MSNNKKRPRAPRTASIPPRGGTSPTPSGPRMQPPSPAAGSKAADINSLMNQLVPVIVKQTDPARLAVEKLRGRPCIVYFLADGAAMSDEQMLHLYEHLRRLSPAEEIDLLISSRGGSTEVPLKVVTMIREFASRVSVLVPYRAHSSATLVALGADEIVMTDMAELGPIDPTRSHPLLPRVKIPGNDEEEAIPISVQDLRHLLRFLRREVGGESDDKPVPAEVSAPLYTALFEKVHPLAIGALEQSWELARQVCRGVLSTHMDLEKEADAIDAIVERLSDHYKSHTTPIGRREARAIGLKVKDATPDERDALWNLHEMYRALVIEGEAQAPDGTRNPARGVGYLASTSGISLGLGFLDPKGKPMGATWHSKWLLGAGGSPIGVAASEVSAAAI